MFWAGGVLDSIFLSAFSTITLYAQVYLSWIWMHKPTGFPVQVTPSGWASDPVVCCLSQVGFAPTDLIDFFLVWRCWFFFAFCNSSSMMTATLVMGAWCAYVITDFGLKWLLLVDSWDISQFQTQRRLEKHNSSLKLMSPSLICATQSHLDLQVLVGL